jgi:hypothetical protein
MSGATPSVPEQFYIFVNQASFWTRHNFTLTGKFVSAAFGAANDDQVPTGTVALWSPGATAPKGGEALRAAYESGALDYLQFDANPNYFGWPTPFGASISNDYRVEYDAEVSRRHYNPLLPSRLSAIYAFGDYVSCEQVHAKHGWPLDEVERFRLLPHVLNRVVRVNMEIVSLAREAYRRGAWTTEQLDGFWRTYWFGGGGISVDLAIDGVNFESVASGEIWEYLIEGVLDRVT